jgi:TAT (twin-arginine translocation) pathway signal sequence
VRLLDSASSHDPMMFSLDKQRQRSHLSRRSFLKLLAAAGAGVIIAGALYACQSDEPAHEFRSWGQTNLTFRALNVTYQRMLDRRPGFAV